MTWGWGSLVEKPLLCLLYSQGTDDLVQSTLPVCQSPLLWISGCPTHLPFHLQNTRLVFNNKTTSLMSIWIKVLGRKSEHVNPFILLQAWKKTSIECGAKKSGFTYHLVCNSVLYIAVAEKLIQWTIMCMNQNKMATIWKVPQLCIWRKLIQYWKPEFPFLIRLSVCWTPTLFLFDQFWYMHQWRSMSYARTGSTHSTTQRIPHDDYTLSFKCLQIT